MRREVTSQTSIVSTLRKQAIFCTNGPEAYYGGKAGRGSKELL